MAYKDYFPCCFVIIILLVQLTSSIPKNERRNSRPSPLASARSARDERNLPDVNPTIRLPESPVMKPGHDHTDTTTLILAQVVFRHGDRTPIKCYPTDPYRNESFWPVGWGQLTNKGKRLEYELGKYLRKRYNGFISESYYPSEVLIRSTDVDRTLMSALSNLAGLFPPGGKEVWEPQLPWQPIPVHTEPKHMDMFSVDAHCPKYDEVQAQALDSPEVQELLANYSQMLSYVSEHTNESIRTPANLSYVYDTLFIEKLNNFPLPNWTASVFPEKMKFLSDFSFVFIGLTHEMRRLTGGRMVGYMLDLMQKKVNGTLGPQMHLYSAHDTTVAALMLALNSFNNIAPPYATTIMLEVHKNESGPIVELFYRNDTSIPPWLITIPGCTPQCPWKDFIRLTSNIIPSDWKKECQKMSPSGIFSDISLVAAIVALVLCLLLVGSIIIGLLCWRSGRHRDYHYLTLQTE